MTALEYVLGGILILCAIVLIVVVLMQDSKSRGVSGVIAGGADNSFGKSKGQARSRKLNTVTAIVSVVLVLVVLVFYLQQYSPANKNPGDTTTAPTTTGPATSAPVTTAPVTKPGAITGGPSVPPVTGTEAA